jgi:hypothetical protein
VLCGAAASGAFTWTPENVAKSALCMLMSGPLLTGYTQVQAGCSPRPCPWPWPRPRPWPWPDRAAHTCGSKECVGRAGGAPGDAAACSQPAGSHPWCSFDRDVPPAPHYIQLQTINDWYDREIDAINEPYRPIPSGAYRGNQAVP